MIAHQQDATARFRHLHHAFDDATRIKAAIDQIAEEDDRRLSGGARFLIIVDGKEQPVQTVTPTVNIANGIHTLARGQRERRRHGLGTGEEFFENHGFQNKVTRSGRLNAPLHAFRVEKRGRFDAEPFHVRADPRPDLCQETIAFVIAQPRCCTVGHEHADAAPH